jgi:threonine synthase
LVGRDGARTKALFGDALSQSGAFTITDEERAAMAGYGFQSGSSSHADRLATIRSTWERFGSLIDTHTADGVKVAAEHIEAGVPMIVLETALPAKFAETIREAVGVEPSRPAKLEGIEALPKRFTVIKPETALVKAFIEQHCA